MSRCTRPSQRCRQPCGVQLNAVVWSAVFSCAASTALPGEVVRGMSEVGGGSSHDAQQPDFPGANDAQNSDLLALGDNFADNYLVGELRKQFKYPPADTRRIRIGLDLLRAELLGTHDFDFDAACDRANVPKTRSESRKRIRRDFTMTIALILEKSGSSYLRKSVLPELTDQETSTRLANWIASRHENDAMIGKRMMPRIKGSAPSYGSLVHTAAHLLAPPPSNEAVPHSSSLI